jgi:hypothetical protein
MLIRKNNNPVPPPAPPSGPGAGRRKGIPNKLTQSIKEMIETAFMNVGGAAYLEKQALENPKAFLALLARIIPQQTFINSSEDLPSIKIVFEKVEDNSNKE